MEPEGQAGVLEEERWEEREECWRGGRRLRRGCEFHGTEGAAACFRGDGGNGALFDTTHQKECKNLGL